MELENAAAGVETDVKLSSYEAPEWARKLAIKPTCRTNLTMKPTPIHRWNLPGIPPEFSVSVKREDLTGSVCSGNKIRKLDFILGEAIQQKCDCVVTLGGIGSNHARTTAIAARQLGLDSHLFLFTKSDNLKDVPCKGNHLLHRISGANIYILPPDTLKLGIPAMNNIIKQFSDRLKSEGHNPYTIPVGGFSCIGSWGYIDAWQEFMQQGVLERFDDIVLAAGTTGCVFGLAVANYLTGSKVKVHGVSIANDAEACYSFITDHLEELGLQVDSRELVNIMDGYIGEGYGKCTEDDLRFIIEVMSTTGISLDPDFTLKGVKGMLSEMRERPHIFKGHRILFVHTGGIFGLLDGRIEDLVATTTASKVKLYSELQLPGLNS